MNYQNPSPPRVRRPDRQCLHAALRDLSHPDAWSLDAVSLDPIALRVVGSDEFNQWLPVGPQHDRRKAARGAIANAITGVVAHMSPGLVGIALGKRHLRADFDPSSLPRLLKPLRHRVVREVQATIEAGGHAAILDLAAGIRHRDLIPDAAPDVMLSPADLEALCAAPTPPPAADSLREGWENADVPGDRALTKAIKYVFGQGWSIDAESGRLDLSLKKGDRFGPHLSGEHLNGETEIARTAAFRAVAQIVPGAGATLLTLLMPEIEGQSVRPDDMSALLSDLQGRLKAALLEAVENEGYEGLRRTVERLGN